MVAVVADFFYDWLIWLGIPRPVAAMIALGGAVVAALQLLFATTTAVSGGLSSSSQLSAQVFLRNLYHIVKTPFVISKVLSDILIDFFLALMVIARFCSQIVLWRVRC